MSHRVSFAITSRDEDPAILTATIEGVLATSKGRWREILVVDDGSIRPVDFSHPDVAILRNAEPVGVCPSRRKALAASSGNVLVTLDAHMTFELDWLDRMLEHVDSRALLCAAWMNYERSRTYCFGADIAWGQSQFTGFGFRHRTEKPRRASSPISVILGACYMIRRDAYEQLGGFCPLFRVWGSDEQDMSIRALMAGLEVRCVAGAGVGHLDRQLPYPVSWDHSIYNEIVMIRSVFEEGTAKLLEEFFEPLSDNVQNWLRALDLREWRSVVQSQRRMQDVDFFRRYAKDAPLLFRNRVELKRGCIPPGRILAALEDQERRAARSLEPRVHAVEKTVCERENSISFKTFGVSMTIDVNDPTLTGRLSDCLPPEAEDAEQTAHPAEAESRYSLMFDPPNYRFSAGTRRVIESADLELVLKVVRAAFQHDVAVEAKSWLFVKAAVVGWRKQAILLLGDRMSGAAALVAELVCAGAEFYSDTYAVFDAQGRILPYARPLELAGESLALGAADRAPLRMGLVALARFRPGSRNRPQQLTTGKGLQALLANGVFAEGRAERAVPLLGRISRGVPMLRITHGDAGKAARALLSMVSVNAK
ncbi:MAG TPA: glycosyltransferase [Bryobacteraceae bacterium]|nr:glycosyltransferase [Bryobacteraceae bacterium]